MRIAILSDVHANLPALEAVLDDIRAAEGFPIVMGNYDDGVGFGRDECGCAYVKERDRAEGDAGFAWTKAHTTEANKAWLRTLAPQVRFEADGRRYLLVHGSPRRINEYLYEDKPDDTFARIGAASDAEVIVCGHTHRAYDKTVAGWRFVNVGSAGKPKDGDPRACYTLLRISREQGGAEGGAPEVHVEDIRVEYDVESAAAQIIESGLPPELADALRRAH
jgi:predicted phosphodiesterase